MSTRTTTTTSTRTTKKTSKMMRVLTMPTTSKMTSVPTGMSTSGWGKLWSVDGVPTDVEEEEKASEMPGERFDRLQVREGGSLLF